jgi:hypothetical protein
VDILPEGPASQAGAQLFGLFGVISLDSKDAVVLDMQANRASAAAVKSGGGADDFYIAIRLADSFIAHFFLLIIRLFKSSVTPKQLDGQSIGHLNFHEIIYWLVGAAFSRDFK